MSGGPPDGSLRWAVKESFVHYVRAVAAGTCEADGEAELGADGVFTFPLIASEREAGRRVFAFGGGARFHAHGGFLDVQLRGLEVWLTEEGAALHIRCADNTRLVLATTGPDGVGRDGIVPLLTGAGSEVFGSVYAEGTELAALDLGSLLD